MTFIINVSKYDRFYFCPVSIHSQLLIYFIQTKSNNVLLRTRGKIVDDTSVKKEKSPRLAERFARHMPQVQILRTQKYGSPEWGVW